MKLHPPDLPKPTGEWTAQTLDAADKAQEWTEVIEKAVTELHGIDKGHRNPAIEALKERSREILRTAINASLAAGREQVKRISDFAAEVVNAKKDPIAICINCGEIQLDQLDEICQTCQRAELRSLTDLREQLAAEREKVILATQMVQIESKRANEAEKQLAVAQAAIADHNSKVFFGGDFDCYKIPTDITALDAAIATATDAGFKAGAESVKAIDRRNVEDSIAAAQQLL